MSSTSGYYVNQNMISDSYESSAIDDDHYADWTEFFESENLELDIESCDHEWEYYQGFSENYEYCTKCDEKREES